MKLIDTKDAVGQVLCHDITQIIKDVKKGPAFRKGHVITEADIDLLLSLGKEHIYVWEKDETMLHEDEAAQILANICMGHNTYQNLPSEGKIEIFSNMDGVLRIDREALMAVNTMDRMMIASRHGDRPIKKGDKIAGTRIIPLVIEKDVMNTVKTRVGNLKIFNVEPYIPKKVGIVTTGNEVMYGRIEDTFTPVVREKVTEYGATILGEKISRDDPEMIISSIRELLDKGAEMIFCTGGMSVDPDDRTPLAIKTVADEVVTYGAPVLPGAMFMLGYIDGEIPIMGLPGCVMYAGRTIFDLVLPRIMTGEKITREIFDSYGEGGLCLGCKVCNFPNCGFGI